MEKQSLKNSAKLLALDVSTSCIGVSVFELKDMKLLEMFHIKPKVIPLPESKTEELLKKADIFKNRISQYIGLGIVSCIIEEPLINSNNVYTVSTLLRFNSYITKSIFDILDLVPEFISTYEARKHAFPDLVRENDKGKKVLFGGFPKDCDKKMKIWERVAEREKQVQWLYDKKGKIKKESFDMADSYCAALGWVNRNRNNK